MHQHFWKRWNLEFLHTLQQRSKWTDPSTPIKVGSVVLIKDDSSPPLHWRVGRVLETHPGSDNVVPSRYFENRAGAAQAATNPNCPSSLTSLFAVCMASLTPVAANGCPIEREPPHLLNLSKSGAPTLLLLFI
ncbi:hypothetical protein NQ318_000892 [Aromia moschata]|uniref:DUF5641 domain-containing protein n=1 Tax=Aromia moschata TaxID=1265417 RepID=A0AAV8ZGF8_9CUCU|nr:hypothetical protein NQ318_000892 [Aromia moschata]